MADKMRLFHRDMHEMTSILNQHLDFLPPVGVAQLISLIVKRVPGKP